MRCASYGDEDFDTGLPKGWDDVPGPVLRGCPLVVSIPLSNYYDLAVGPETVCRSTCLFAHGAPVYLSHLSHPRWPLHSFPRCPLHSFPFSST